MRGPPLTLVAVSLAFVAGCVAATPEQPPPTPTPAGPSPATPFAPVRLLDETHSFLPGHATTSAVRHDNVTGARILNLTVRFTPGAAGTPILEGATVGVSVSLGELACALRDGPFNGFYLCWTSMPMPEGPLTVRYAGEGSVDAHVMVTAQ